MPLIKTQNELTPELLSQMKPLKNQSGSDSIYMKLQESSKKTPQLESLSQKLGLRDSDLQLILQLLSPDYLIPAAEIHGRGDKVKGAMLAHLEVRNMIRDYARYVRWRDDKKVINIKLALLLRACGWVPQSYKHVLPLDFDSEWRNTATVFWPEEKGNIPGAVQVTVGDVSEHQVRRAVVRVVSKLLDKHPEVNRAVLDGRVWQRRSAEVMIHQTLRNEELRSLVFDASRMSDQQLQKKMRSGLKALIESQEHGLGTIAGQMLRAWAGKFITSPAGAMITWSNAPLGWACLAPNGVPLVVQVGRIIDGKVWIACTVDHRAIDGNKNGTDLIYGWLEEKVPIALQGEI